jgi:hypothetical protein
MCYIVCRNDTQRERGLQIRINGSTTVEGACKLEIITTDERGERYCKLDDSYTGKEREYKG